ncbi:entero Ail/Lom protein [Escherichia coli]|uniref:Entero Ail/Lom protein n=1 Tax=Escherichia coli TaxID=562 RepID=A0A484X7Z1_ECOLX|nr:entero Ail/Lom protein [Escherichia coli]
MNGSARIRWRVWLTSRVSTFSGDYLRVTDNKGKTHDVLTGSDDGRHSNTSLAWGLACSLTRPNP